MEGTVLFSMLTSILLSEALHNNNNNNKNNDNNNNNNSFIVQSEWKYILHFGGCIRTQYLNHIVMHVYSKIMYINM